MTLTSLLEEASDYLRGQINAAPKTGLILGSGLGVLADEIEDPVKIPYENIPGFPVSTVEGHAGQLVAGTLEGREVIAMQGRFHYYEGYTLQDVTFPVRVMRRIGVENLLVTNAAGSVNETFSPGNLMVIKDHLNLLGDNPLIGQNDESTGPRFPDLSSAYSKELIETAESAASSLGITLQKGIYAANTGPAYETPAEVKMIRTLGADAVGMSTVPEVISANHAGMRVLGISCLSNMAAGILDQPLSHDEVIETTEKVRGDFLQLMKEIIGRLEKGDE
ncbi:purine-nucleoside phosphorylase [Salibacterium halotolerans]|uniref:Purine nucleoside phosphorylase n=1 Tax=Salibacterium halotolerans TaxID=1884432 RepID=A0A1I5NTG2_9BACI|nr:purine-nucleoside phosphorylase [Salibacterium halotolerans]SFP25063.1 purine-nucleoside phosphorylase [Salibacterium halotolerans]